MSVRQSNKAPKLSISPKIQSHSISKRISAESNADIYNFKWIIDVDSQIILNSTDSSSSCEQIADEFEHN